jgi:hypothetical protein
MSSTYSPDLRIELIGTGDQAGVWGNTTNTNLGTLMENAVAGYTSVSIIASPQALTANDGALDEARFAVIALTTTTAANFTVCIPPNSKLYTFYNASSYIATITNSTVKNGIIASGGTTVAIPAGKTMSVWSDGTNVAQQTNHFISPTLASPTMTSPTMTTPVLGTPASGTMTNVTGLPLTTGVTGTLPVANGGTGVTTKTGTGNVVLSDSPTLVTPALGTPSSGTLTNCTFPTLNQNTTGTAAFATNPAGGGSFITSSNIGSQSVTYATTAGSANAAPTAVSNSGSLTGNLANSSRFLDTTYTNSSGRPRVITVSGNNNTNAGNSVYVNGAYFSAINHWGAAAGFTFVVPDGGTYYVDSSGFGLQYWYEFS